jgi:hypothetical protein
MPKLIAKSCTRQGDPSSRGRHCEPVTLGSTPLHGSDQLVVTEATRSMIDKRSGRLTNA